MHAQKPVCFCVCVQKVSDIFSLILFLCMFGCVQKVSDIFSLIVQEIERSQNVCADSQKGGCIVS